MCQAIWKIDKENRFMDYVQRKNFNARLEPIDTVFHGAGQDHQSFVDYSALFDSHHRPLAYMTYISITASRNHVVNWGTQLNQDLVNLNPNELYLQIGLNMTGGNDTGEGLDVAVAKGVYDAQIDAFCDAIETIGYPAYVRIGYEFEGEWNGYSSEGYRQAFIHVTNAMRDRKLNIATVWCSSGASAGEVDMKRLMPYYPGDEWVDWWGIDTFEASELLADSTRIFCETAREHGKPVMIGESTPRYVGVLDGQASWDTWFAPYFELIRRQPEIKLFSYINWDWVYWSDTLGFEWHDWKDARLQLNELVATKFQDEMKCPIYQHQTAEKNT